MATDAQASVARADIVGCATLATSPVVRRDWLRPGTHLDLIGSFTPQIQEADPACFEGARVWVDTQEASAKAGDLLRAFEAVALAPSSIAGDLALLCRQGTVGRGTPEERTVFRPSRRSKTSRLQCSFIASSPSRNTDPASAA